MKGYEPIDEDQDASEEVKEVPKIGHVMTEVQEHLEPFNNHENDPEAHQCVDQPNIFSVDCWIQKQQEGKYS